MSTKYGVKEVCDITFYDLVTGQPVLFLDTLKMTSIENKATTSYARGGKGNPKLLAWDFDREATVKMQDALMSMESLSQLVGNALTKGVATAYKREVLTAVSGTTGQTKVTLAKAPDASSVQAFKSGDLSTKLTSTVSSSDVTFTDTDVPVGTVVEVYYTYQTSATTEKVTITSDHFPAYVKVIGDTVIRNATTGADEAFQIIIHKAKINPTFTMDLKSDGDPSVFEMDLDVFRRDTDTEMIELIKY